MNTYQFQIKAHDNLGAMERILRVVRHRGGRIAQLNMQAHSDHYFDLTIILQASRPAEFIRAQVAKLVDVISVE